MTLLYLTNRERRKLTSEQRLQRLLDEEVEEYERQKQELEEDLEKGREIRRLLNLINQMEPE